MDDMREIVTVEQMDRLFLALAIAGPLLGAIVGAFIGRRANPGRGALKGFLFGLVGLANLLLWKIYNVLTDHMGLDTVKNLLVQLGLFVLLGIIVGLVAGYLTRSNRPGSGGTDDWRSGQSFDDGGGSSPVTAGGPSIGRAPGEARTMAEAEEPPRDA
jgi:hypothetical protein